MSGIMQRHLQLATAEKIVLFAIILLPFANSQTQGVNPEAGTSAKTATAVLQHHPVIAPFHVNTYVLLYSIDGKGPQDFERKHLKTLCGTFNSRLNAAFDVVIPAGKHTLTFSHIHEVPLDIKRRVSFVAEPGHSYRVKAEKWRKQWSPAIEDVTIENSPRTVAVEAEP